MTNDAPDEPLDTVSSDVPERDSSAPDDAVAQPVEDADPHKAPDPAADAAPAAPPPPDDDGAALASEPPADAPFDVHPTTGAVPADALPAGELPPADLTPPVDPAPPAGGSHYVHIAPAEESAPPGDDDAGSAQVWPTGTLFPSRTAARPADTWSGGSAAPVWPRPPVAPEPPHDSPERDESLVGGPEQPPTPRPSRADRRAAEVAPPTGPRAASTSEGGDKPRRRRGRLLAALIALVVLVAAAVSTVVYLDRRDSAPGQQAEAVPDAVLPELTDPAPALAALAVDAPAPDPTVLAGVLAPLLAAPALGSGLSALVVDVATGDVLFDQDGADPATPASTAKLLTALAALTTLDPTTTLPTTVVAGSAPGEVVLVGGGDPTLSTTDPSTAYPGAATVADLAAQVQRTRGDVPVTRVVVDNSLFIGPLTAPGWQPDDAPSTYAAPVTATAVDGARVDPDASQRSGAPGTDAGRALAAALGAPAAEVALGGAPAGAATLGTVRSAPVERLVEQALTASDNLLAESLARHVAIARGLPASFAGGAQAVPAALADAGLDITGLSLVDASGLSAQDQVPARLLVDVVRAASDGAVPAAAGLLSGLPVAGYDGTLADRTADGAGVPGAVRAKTGTLLAVHDLAGTVLTADGRLLAFAVLADGAGGSSTGAETALDEVAGALAGCGCR